MSIIVFLFHPREKLIFLSGKEISIDLFHYFDEHFSSLINQFSIEKRTKRTKKV